MATPASFSRTPGFQRATAHTLSVNLAWNILLHWFFLKSFSLPPGKKSRGTEKTVSTNNLKRCINYSEHVSYSPILLRGRAQGCWWDSCKSVLVRGCCPRLLFEAVRPPGQLVAWEVWHMLWRLASPVCHTLRHHVIPLLLLCIQCRGECGWGDLATPGRAPRVGAGSLLTASPTSASSTATNEDFSLLFLCKPHFIGLG